MPDYTKPTLFTTRQILGRGNLEVLRDNDDFFWAMAHALTPIPGNLNSTTASQALFDGWHYYRADATDLDYYVTLNAGGGTLYLYYDYGGIHEQQPVVDTSTAGTVTSDVRGLYDIAAEDSTPRPEGIYRVYCYVNGGTGYCRPPYTTYTGDEYFHPPFAPIDGTVSQAAMLNQIRGNDIYFNACRPVNIAFGGMRRSGSSKNCWDGYAYHRGTRLYYRISLPSNWDDGVDSFSLHYDYGGANQQELLSWTTAGTRESYVDLDTTSYTYTPGQRYRVTARVNSGRYPDVQYLFMEPQTTDVGPGMSASDWGYTLMDDFGVGQWVYGNTAGQLTRLRLFHDNAKMIFSALCTSAKVGRRDYAVRKPSVTIDSVTYKGDLRIVHRYDTLVYRSLSGEMSWGTNTESLSDYTADDAYMTLDLRSLDLAYGQVYKISGEPVEFAAEIP